MAVPRVKVGTAGWSMPRDVADGLPAALSGLARYATAFQALEINSSFHRPHRPTTYARWSATVPDGFRFAVKLPKTITHDARLIDADALIDAFLEETANLGVKRGPILVQTPPKLEFDALSAGAVVDRLTRGGVAAIAWEPRHASWFTSDTDAWLADHRIARVAADPARHPDAGHPGGWLDLAYYRLHGAPRMYYSPYETAALFELRRSAENTRAGDIWIMFDNTASGEAARNALALASLVSEAGSEP